MNPSSGTSILVEKDGASSHIRAFPCWGKLFPKNVSLMEKIGALLVRPNTLICHSSIVL